MVLGVPILKHFRVVLVSEGGQHVLIGDNLPVRKNYFNSDIMSNKNAKIL